MRPSPQVLLLVSTFLAASACCRWNDPPVWVQMAPIGVGEAEKQVDLLEWVVDDGGHLDFTASSSDEGLLAWTSDEVLKLQAQPGWSGEAEVTLTVTDRCGESATTRVEVVPGDDTDDTGDTGDPDIPRDPCEITFTYRPSGSPDAVYLAGAFNDWSPTETPLEAQGDGTWSVGLVLEEGAWPYKFVEVTGGSQAWSCDPDADLIQCDEGYKAADDTTWDHVCTPGGTSCNSLVRVENCGRPRLRVDRVDIDRAGGGIRVEVTATLAASEAAITDAVVTLDGEPVDGGWDGGKFTLSLAGLSPTRHTLRFQVTDADGVSSTEAYVPFWLDDTNWDGGLMYYAFVDRVADGDTSINGSEGASYELASYMGGDFQGLVDLLPYLDDLGVTVLWISNPQDNAEGAFSGDCGTYSGYHAYWPDAARGVEEHFGGAEGLRTLVAEAHARNMRVVMDWVANHVHEDHPYYLEHADDGWFNDEVLCKIGDDYSNFDRIPETCWFAEYLPDIRFYDPEPLDRMVEDAIWWIREFELDGFRVDGAKHVPQSVVWNLAGRLDQAVEHRTAGGDEDFYTVGETFSTSRDWIEAYIGPHQLDAQFDFPLYFTLRSVFIDGSASLRDLSAAVADSDASYGGAVMSAFLGNHDVSRFTSYAVSGGWADSDDSACVVADVTGEGWAYDRLRLAWTFLLTRPGLPLVYYGDELGIPGYKDPDNRHPLWWYSSAIGGGSADLADVAAGLHHPDQHLPVLEHLATLGQARRNHPALSGGSETEWWLEDDVWAYARVDGTDQALVILNRGGTERTLANGLAWAGLSQGTWEDLLTGATFSSSGDQLSVTVPAGGARVLVRR